MELLGDYMYIDSETRSNYKKQLIVYYFNKVDIKTDDTMRQVKRQVESMDDKVLISNYNRIFNNDL